MPGDLITTSCDDKASASGAMSITRRWSSCDATACAASSGLQCNVKVCAGKRRRNAFSAARPSRPNPQIATSRPSSSANRIERSDEACRDAMLPGSAQPRFKLLQISIELWRVLLAETRDQRILAPFRARGQRGERGARLLCLAHAFERLVVAVFDQCVEARGLRFVVQQVASENREQAWLRQERRECQEHEMAFRAVPAPAVRRLRPEDAEIA